MRVMGTTARLLAATAICCAFSARALAQDYGLESTDATPISNPSGSTIEGAKTGIYSTGSELNLDNAGTIRGNGNQAFFGNSAGGVVLQGGPGYITNSGSISGLQFGITTIYVTTEPFDGRAIGSTVDNSGSIIGDNNDGIRLIGGGTVTNSGYIAGRAGAGADGISMFSFEGQDLNSFSVIGSVTNTATGVIEGNRYGVILSNGGIVDNAGTISGNSGSILMQAQAVGSEPPRTGTVTNSGTLNGVVLFNNLASASVDNSGAISSTDGPAIHSTAPSGSLAVTNEATGSITGATSGIFSEGSAFTLVNDGTIRGNGSTGGTTTPDGGIVVTGGPADITNSGTISGQRFGITTAFYFDPAINDFDLAGRAIGSTVTNTGTIIGDTDDGVRLIGGGTITNSGYIAGRVGSLADGISMFAYNNQDTTSLPSIGTVINLAGGIIEGNRFGIILSGGGDIDNAGTINGGTNGAILIQTGFIDGKIGTVTNSGSINGVVGFVGLASATLDNSGSIAATAGPALFADLGTGPFSVTNSATGSITGATSGIYSQASSLSLTNDGTIRGNGSYDGFDAPPDAGVDIAGGPATITNSGTISGERFGITTSYVFNPETGLLEGRAIDSSVTNSGTIIGDTDDGIRLIGGGTVTNSGYIAGRVGEFADGISMFFFDGQTINPAIGSGSVSNLAGGVIEGNRYGVKLDGGTVDNAGTISGNAGGVLITALVPGLTGTVTNSGTVNGGVLFSNLASATLGNSGSITAAAGPGVSANATTGLVSVGNDATGSITGSTSGIFSQASAFTLTNDGTIRGNGTVGNQTTPDAGIVTSGASATITNSGTISGQRFGITTAQYLNPNTGLFEGQASGSTVSNIGTIIGDNDDGIRLIGGGSVTNSGYVAGRVGSLADGISMFAFGDQDTSSLTGIGTVTNLAGGVIEGNRFGIILSGGGIIDNAGTISGSTNAGILIQGDSGSAPKTGSITNSGTVNNGVSFFGLAGSTLTNSGTINGVANSFNVTDVTVDNSGTITGTIGVSNATNGVVTNSGSVEAFTYFNNVGTASLDNSGTLGDFVQFSGVGSASLTNSGSIAAGLGASTYSVGSAVYSDSALTLTNLATGTITALDGPGPLWADVGKGIYQQAGLLTLDNAGTVYGDGFGIYAAGTVDVTNSGSISSHDEDGVAAQGAGSAVNNSGSISGGFHGVAMTNGSVVNSGHITGENLIGGGSGVWLGSGSVSNLAGGVIEGKNSAGVIIAGNGTVTNAGTITGRVLLQGSSATITNSGAITSSAGAAIETAGATTLVNSGTVNGTGGTAVKLSSANDSVTLQTGSSINGAVDGGNGNDSLTLSGTTAGVTPLQTVGSFLNFETLNVLGGYWTATGNTGTFNSATISGGTFAVNGSITSPIAVNSGATLAGTGTITGNVTVAAGGVFSPGNSIGTINVTGNVNFAAGSVFRVETTPAGLSDRLAATGTVTLGSGTSLQVLAGSGTYGPKTSYTILTANGGISGKFGSVTTDLAFLSPQVATKVNSVVLTLTRNGKPLTSAASATTLGTATAISSFDEGNPIYQALLGQSVSGAGQAFESLSGGAYGRIDELLAGSFGRPRFVLDDGAANAPWLGWTDQPISSRGFHSGRSARHGGLAIMTVGGGYGSRISAEGVSADVQTRFVGAALGYRSGRFSGYAGAATAWHELAASRAIRFPGFSDSARAHYLARSHRLDAEGSYALWTARLRVDPYVGFSHVTVKSQAFDEAGGISALSFDRQSRSIDQLRIGVRAARPIALRDIALTAHLDASLERSWGDLGQARTARFAIGGEEFDSVSAAFNRRTIAVDAGLDMRLGPVTVAGSYRGRLGDQWSDHSALLSAGLRF